MANFTLETNRNNAIANIPRLTFQLPQSTTSTVPSTTSPIFFCQTGCQLDFQFANITSATLKNDGNYFTILPNENSNNYINWNGSGVSGQNMTRFDLKEIKFTTPARDVIGSITYNKSIQFYLTFVNSTYANIMIIITIIGQSNNVGTAQTDGYILLNSLAPQIPLRNDTRTITDLANVNLGYLLPSNKSFFSTLIENNTLQYISMTRVIDIPETFLNNLISRIIGSQQAYESKVNQYTQQIPTNPQGTIIFYTENVKPINSDQAYVCNANCDRVVGDSKLLEPTIGTSKSTTKSTTKSTPSKSPQTIGGKNADKLKQEECEEELIIPGRTTKVNVKGGSSSTSADKSNKKDLTDNEKIVAMNEGLIIGGSIVGIVSSLVCICILLSKATNSTIFSKELWLNKENIPWIVITFIGFLGITSCLISFIFVAREDIINKDDKKSKYKIPSWGLLLIGIIGFYLPCCIILVLKSKNIFFTNNLENLESVTNRMVENYRKNPDSYLNSKDGKNSILKASKIYSSLSNEQRSILNKNYPGLSKLQTKNITNISPKDLDKLIQIFKNNPIVITPEIKSAYDGLLIAKENTPEYSNLKSMEKNVAVGKPVPSGLVKLLKK